MKKTPVALFGTLMLLAFASVGLANSAPDTLELSQTKLNDGEKIERTWEFQAPVLAAIDSKVTIGVAKTLGVPATDALDLGVLAPATDAWTETTLGVENPQIATTTDWYLWIVDHLSNGKSLVELTPQGSWIDAKYPIRTHGKPDGAVKLENVTTFFENAYNPMDRNEIVTDGEKGVLVPSVLPTTRVKGNKLFNQSLSNEPSSWPNRISLNINDEWLIPAGNYESTIGQAWSVALNKSLTQTARLFAKDPTAKVTVKVDKAIKKGLGFGVSDTPAVYEKANGFDVTGDVTGLKGSFYAGHINLLTNAAVYNRLSFSKASGSDEAVDLRNYIALKEWKNYLTYADPVKIAAEADKDFVLVGSDNADGGYSHKYIATNIAHLFDIAIPGSDVFKVAAGNYSMNIKSEWAFDKEFTKVATSFDDSVSMNVEPVATFGVRLGAELTKDKFAPKGDPWNLVFVKEGNAGKTEQDGLFDGAKPGEKSIYNIELLGQQNHDRLVTVSTESSMRNQLELAMVANNENVTERSNKDLKWEGVFKYNNAGAASDATLRWTFSPDWTTAPGEHSMAVTVSSAPQL